MRENAFRNVLLQLLGILIAGCCNPVVPLPDLTVTQVTAPVGLVNRTDPLNLGARIQNTGTVEAEPFVLEYWLSTNAVIDVGDLLIASTQVVAGLGAGEPFEDSIIGSSVEILGGKPGTNHIIVYVDAASQVAETSEMNNTASAAIAVVYDRIIIDTYDPVKFDSVNGVSALYSNVIELFGPSGDTSTPQGYNLWSPPVELVSAAIASNMPVNTRPIGNPYYDYAYIDYTTGLAPGDYYLRIRMVNFAIDTIPYALRVLTAPDNSYSEWLFVNTNAGDGSDAPVTGGEGVPSSYQSMVLGDKLNRYLHAGEVHWVKLTLP